MSRRVGPQRRVADPKPIGTFIGTRSSVPHLKQILHQKIISGYAPGFQRKPTPNIKIE
ncbi:hypothetical protein [Methylobacterium gossipiicola]|uniref:hypothetical protein n=1 Tax=Methylobacterium gossipiicola TaxID=582675 RepID=UPI0015A71DB4|nr:hypothetical protein [Methylobacterium gossipiicola]